MAAQNYIEVSAPMSRRVHGQPGTGNRNLDLLQPLHTTGPVILSGVG